MKHTNTIRHTASSFLRRIKAKADYRGLSGVGAVLQWCYRAANGHTNIISAFELRKDGSLFEVGDGLRYSTLTLELEIWVLADISTSLSQKRRENSESRTFTIGETEEAYQVKPGAKTWQEWWDVIGVGGEGSYIRSRQLEGHASALPPRTKNPFHFLLLCFRHGRALFSQGMGLSDSESEGFVLSESLGRILSSPSRSQKPTCNDTAQTKTTSPHMNANQVARGLSQSTLNSERNGK
ncbi:hypothetical protein SRHO_G00000330 [Serrasalmus rhombeus]